MAVQHIMEARPVALLLEPPQLLNPLAPTIQATLLVTKPMEANPELTHKPVRTSTLFHGDLDFQTLTVTVGRGKFAQV